RNLGTHGIGPGRIGHDSDAAGASGRQRSDHEIERIIVTKQDTSVAGAVLSDGRRQRLHLSGKLGESQPPPAAGERQRIAAVAHMLGKRRSDEAHVREISALGRPRAIDWATMAAATALIRSPGMNTVTALAAASRSSPA